MAAIEGDAAPALSVGDVIVRIDPRYFRPAEVETLLGDPSEAKAKLGWMPEITVQEMWESTSKRGAVRRQLVFPWMVGGRGTIVQIWCAGFRRGYGFLFAA